MGGAGRARTPLQVLGVLAGAAVCRSCLQQQIADAGLESGCKVYRHAGRCRTACGKVRGWVATAVSYVAEGW